MEPAERLTAYLTGTVQSILFRAGEKEAAEKKHGSSTAATVAANAATVDTARKIEAAILERLEKLRNETAD